MILGVMFFAMTSSAAGHNNGYYYINCTLNCYSRYATATTDGAQSYGKDTYNRVLVYTRKSNGVKLSSGYNVAKLQARATTGKSSGVVYADSYHFVSDSKGSSIEPLYHQVKKIDYK